ncbi:MAG TPA: amidase [Pseudonocardiaceae bacterium]
MGRARSTLLLAGTVVGLVLGTVPSAAGPPAGPAAPDPAAAAAEADLARARAAIGTDLDSATIPVLQQRMRDGRLSSVTLTLAYLARIRVVDRKVNAVLEVNPVALAEAAASDVHRRTRGARGPLEGIPVLLKDNVNTRVQPATAGSRALARARADRDADLVRRLHAAGAVVIGKANLSEWANFRSTNSTSGWSAVGGLTNNPYVLDRNPCGSSSGSGAGVAASLAQVAIGTETDGSIVCPSGQNGVVGIKPTLGLVSRTGVVPLSLQQDTAGPMARHVVDAALTLAVLQGVDPADPATREIPATQPRDYTAGLTADGLRGKRIGVFRKAGRSPEADVVVQRAVEAAQRAGATVIEVELPYQDEADAAEFPALLSEFKADINAYLAATPGRHPRDLAGLIEFNENDPVELRYFGQEIFLQAQSAPDDASEARATATGLQRRAIDETLAAHRLDAIMAPTNSPAWRSTLGEGDAFVLGSSSPAAVSGYPNITVPAGFAGELPVGVSFFGSRWNEAGLIGIAYAFEQQTHARRAPRYLPTIG